MFSGEQTTKYTHSDFEAVQREFLSPLLAILEIGPEQVFMVPGNHEMDRRAVPTEKQITTQRLYGGDLCEDDLQEDLRTKLNSYFNFVEKHGYNSVTNSNPRLNTFDVSGQKLVCLNGLVGSYSKPGTGDKGELFVLPSELGGILASIPKHAVVITHHPLSWFDDKCERDIMELLSSRNCRLMTGHIHKQGAHWIETSNGTLAEIQAGASAESGESNEVAIAWLPPSDSAAVRHFSFNFETGALAYTPVSSTRVIPNKAQDYFQRTEAFFDPSAVDNAREKAADECQNELATSYRRPSKEYVAPDLVIYSEDQFSGKRIKHETFLGDQNNRVISGDELSGKTSFLNFSAMRSNELRDNGKVSLTIDFRILSAGKDLEHVVTKKLKSFGLTSPQSDHFLEVGLVSLWFDNFDADNSKSVRKFFDFFSKWPRIKWTIAVRGTQRYLHSRSPAAFPDEGISYYELSEISLRTVLAMIERHEEGKEIEKPRAVVERVFRSINNLRAPRTVFYVDSLVNLFLSDGSVEPLNRYLLIENLLSERIRHAHKIHLPNQAVDMEMVETFIGLVAHFLLENEQPYLSKADYYGLVASFVERKGLQPKRFSADSILKILIDSFVLREYEDGFAFIMLSIEDYFLAKHMSRDERFRTSVMSMEGLLKLPSVAEYYIAQNPSDRIRIEQIFEIIRKFEEESWPLIESLEQSTLVAIQTALPGNPSKLQEELIDQFGEVEADDDATLVVSERPERIGQTKRVRFSSEERGSVFLQLGASILGVTRTLDQSDRVKIFERLRKILLISLNGVPLIAQHLADGGEVKVRGVNIKADYVGALSNDEDRFYLILRGMLYNVLQHFATWAGSPSFFNAAVKLRQYETDELIAAALFAQNIEADLNEAIQFIPEIKNSIESPILQEITLRLFVDAMSLVPLDSAEEKSAIDRLVDATIAINPPKAAQNPQRLELQKNRLRQDFREKIGLSAFVGKLVKQTKKK